MDQQSLGSWFVEQMFSQPPQQRQQQGPQQQMPFLQPGRGVWPAEVYNDNRLMGQTPDTARQNLYQTMSTQPGWLHPGVAPMEDVIDYMNATPMAANKPQQPQQPILPPEPWQPPDWA